MSDIEKLMRDMEAEINALRAKLEIAEAEVARLTEEREDFYIQMTALRARVQELEGQHKGLVIQNGLLRQRPDLPVDRIPVALEVEALRAQMENARSWLADVDIASLPNDFPLDEIARIRMQTLAARTLEGLALIGKIEMLTTQLEKAKEALGSVLCFAEEWYEHIGSDQTFPEDDRAKLDKAAATLKEIDT